MDIMEQKNIEFKDLDSLSTSELYEELTSVFGDFPYAKIKNAKAYYEFFKIRTPEGKPALIIYRVRDAIFNLLEDNEVNVRNIEMLSGISKLLEMARGATECDENYLYGVYKFCKKYRIEKYRDLKDLILGYGYYNMFLKSNSDAYVKYDLLDFLETINSREDLNKLINCCKEMSSVSNIFRYELQKRYPGNTNGLFSTIKHCFGCIREHFGLDTIESEMEERLVLPDRVKNALYGMACLYEKLVVNIGENDTFNGDRFADEFLREYSNFYAENKKSHIGRKDAYRLDDFLKVLTGGEFGEENIFSGEELKDFLISHIENFYSLRDDTVRTMYEKTKKLTDYANSGSGEKVAFKKFIHNGGVRKASILYRPEYSIDEEVGLLTGQTLEEAYVLDDYKENKYKYYLLGLEMKELFSDVKISGITPNSINKLINKNIDVCNNLSVARIQTILTDMIETLYDVYGIDDGKPKYLNNKIEDLTKMGFDVKNLIHIDNLEYVCGNDVVVKNMNGDMSFWYSFKENIIRLSSYYTPQEISEMIKHYPEIIFADYNEMEKYARTGQLVDYVDSVVGDISCEQI